MPDASIQTVSPENLAAACRAAAQANAADLDALTSRIAVYDTQSILTFGAEAAAELAQSSDAVLRSIQSEQAGDPGPLLNSLAALMEKLDMRDLTGEKKRGLFSLRPASADPEHLVEKYRALEEDVSHAYIALKQYEAQLRACDGNLKAVYDRNLRFYETLVRYILAGEQGLEEIRAYLRQLEVAQEGPGGVPSDLDTVRHSYALLERRVHDLRVAEIAALQSLPMLQLVRENNRKLIQKLNTAFLVTLPIFRQSLAQAAARKRIRLQAQAMEALDRRTQADLAARGASGAGLKGAPEAAEQLEALEQARKTILQGIAETRALQREAAAFQKEAAVRQENPGGGVV